MDPTTKKQPTTTAAGATAGAPPSSPSDPLSFSALYKVVKHKAHNPQKRHPIHHHSPPSTLSKASDPHRFQPKSLALSFDAHTSSSSLLIKSTKQPKKQQPKEEKMEKQRPIKEKHKIEPAPKKVEQQQQQPAEEEQPKRVSISLVNGGRRRSFCDTKIELNDFFANVGARVVAVDMPPFMQIHAISCARKTYDCLEKLSSKTIACTLKKEFDGVYGPAWHCIVGTSFGSFVTHSVGGFLYFSMDHHKLYILLFKTSVQRAD